MNQEKKRITITTTMYEHLIECKEYNDLNIPGAQSDFPKTLKSLLLHNLVTLKNVEGRYHVYITDFGRWCIHMAQSAFVKGRRMFSFFAEDYFARR